MQKQIKPQRKKYGGCWTFKQVALVTAIMVSVRLFIISALIVVLLITVVVSGKDGVSNCSSSSSGKCDGVSIVTAVSD